jgi:hypothetical protein
MIKSRRMRWGGHVARMGETRNEYRILVGKPEGKISLGRPSVFLQCDYSSLMKLGFPSQINIIIEIE